MVQVQSQVVLGPRDFSIIGKLFRKPDFEDRCEEDPNLTGS
jgi:hypothetical protein